MLQLEHWKYPKAEKTCPYCHKGVIKPIGNVLYQETMSSQKNNQYQPVGIHAPSAERLCAFLLKCESCGESLLTHYLEIEDVRHVDQEGNELLEYSHLQYFPAPPLIDLPQSCPQGVQAAFERSFFLFWADLPSCANKIRVAVELLMKEQGMNRGKESLDKRIRRFTETHPELGGFLMSIKLLGNTGSHDTSIPREDVIDAFRLMEHILDELYTDRRQELQKISDRLSATHGPKPQKQAE